jgi:hypothetical protein
VTRFGEFSPIGRLIAEVFGKKIQKYLAKSFGPLSPRQRCSFNLDKNGLGDILGDFFTNSSGHTAAEGLEFH